ncbi:diaminopimelate epimerase [Candidatus Nomurabacteria bacterium]|nr:diaminopimelate epimerase [Candidatus Nomurabacteria bacterium]
MNIIFYKYNGAGNDFVMLDNREEWFDWENKELIARLCDRKFGVGADGIILLQNHDEQAFEMFYANSDGSRGSMCGNGGRCIVAFAHQLGIIEQNQEITFMGPDAPHQGILVSEGKVKIDMIDVKAIQEKNGLTFVSTGTPHHIQYVPNLKEFPIVTEARKLRDRCSEKDGVNVNYVEHIDGQWHVRTYERGVEDETLACGTGATAVALALAEQKGVTSPVAIHMPGGVLTISFDYSPEQGFTNVWLEGPATFVFEGEMEV